MRHSLKGLLFLIITFSLLQVSAQNKTGIIEKNINIEARELYHDLNTSKDTLILKSKSKMHYVYSLNSKNQREIDRPIFSNTFKIPLQKLSAGKHLFAVSYQQKKVLFVVRVHDPNLAYISQPRGTEVATRNN